MEAPCRHVGHDERECEKMRHELLSMVFIMEKNVIFTPENDTDRMILNKNRIFARVMQGIER